MALISNSIQCEEVLFDLQTHVISQSLEVTSCKDSGYSVLPDFQKGSVVLSWESFRGHSQIYLCNLEGCQGWPGPQLKDWEDVLRQAMARKLKVFCFQGLFFLLLSVCSERSYVFMRL